jgi:protein TonB
MSSLFYVLNIATLAIWLSVAGLDVVAWVIPIWHLQPTSSRAGETAALLPPPEISLGSPTEPMGAADTAEPTPTIPEVIPTPPKMPEIAEFSPLPELPVMPAPPALSSEPTTSHDPQPVRRPTAKPRGRTDPAAGSGASSMSAAGRLAAGQMPPPVYPAEARRQGQTGTVLVEFTIGVDGRVLSAFPKIPSPWPLLNDAAVHTVRGWLFPPGAVIKLQRPIVFQLN